MNQKIRILLVEDQTLVRDALKQLLTLQAELDVVATADNGLAAKAILEQQSVDLVLTDIEMPQLDGLSLCAWVTDNMPHTKTLILTTYNRSGYLKRAVKAGAMGFILKEVEVEQLTQAVLKVVAGERCFDPELVLAGLSEEDPLTERERQALRLSREGLSTAAIAKKMCLSHGTVRNYLSEAMNKLYASSRLEAANIAAEKGWL